ncbi:MAG: 23S rRNA (pseudouridine(1915)-N(3))-methyltransferase RlmH [Gammaproteobacteria bacterium]|nr:23S rRNA (pseudouridine(1915)-N(3))-methyltransferase RlmH [Gammaproteobacteria bacterium]
MQIRLICVSRRIPSWAASAYAEYARRLPRACGLDLREIPLRKRPKGGDISRFRAEEGKKMLAAIPSGALTVALDEHGKTWTTPQFAEELKNWMQSGRSTALLVGGPDGLSSACLQRADRLWSLSSLTMPHALVRVIVAEQLYRAWTLLNNHPYHRA